MPVHVIENAGPPSAAPTAIGVHFVDTVSGQEYYSTGTSTVDDWRLMDSVIVDSVAPSGAPAAIGLHWVNTSNGDEYFSTGTSTVADWKLRGSGGGGGGSTGHPATRDYAIVVYNDEDQAGALGHFVISEDGGDTFVKTGSPDNAAPGAGDRLGGQESFSRTVKGERIAVGVGLGFFIYSSEEYGGLTGRQYIRCTMDQGATWKNLAQALNSDVNSGAAQGGAADYADQFMNVAWDGTLHYQILCHETGTDDYIIESIDGGANWARKIISGSLLTSLETLSNYHTEGGLWYAFGAWWAATQFDNGAGLAYVEIHKSTDGGATWTLFHTFNAAAEQGWGTESGASNQGVGDGVIVTSTLGVFYFIGNDVSSSGEVWRQVDAVTPPALVFDALTAVGAVVGFVPTNMKHQAYSKGRVDDGLVERVFVQVTDTTHGYYQCYTEDGTTWDVDGYISINDNYFVRGYSFNDWDGYAHIYWSENSSERVHYYTKDGILCVPHSQLSRQAGERTPGELLGFANGDGVRWHAVVDRP